MKVYVLRLGHRPGRDKRITTHVGLTARAFGADGFILADVSDERVLEKLREACRRWGKRDFHLECGVNGVKYIKEWRKAGGVAVHLTMYGLHLDDVVDEIGRSSKDILVIVGASKVPRIVYELADYNVAVGHQPHSEVAALAVFLDRLFRGKELHFIFPDAELCIVPSPKGKKVAKCGEKKNK
ncbi:MAG: tRNA (cytidine(56)-2'-O)-methyltransferase [Desulfurococcales archaeon]|nr:tRNA (cytidine(56)-2'-O)-methyltransferase [Desulfurococcales archaeon]